MGSANFNHWHLCTKRSVPSTVSFEGRTTWFNFLSNVIPFCCFMKQYIHSITYVVHYFISVYTMNFWFLSGFRLFGTSGACTACGQQIPASELVMRTQNRVYHLKCFACSSCHIQLVPGDRYTLVNGSIVCENDHSKLFKAASHHGMAPGHAPGLRPGNRVSTRHIFKLRELTQIWIRWDQSRQFKIVTIYLRNY